MRGGRARWKIENETFNTLKNQGYHLEHNYGHGEQNLSVVLALLMMLAFLVDQTQQLCCPLFQAAWAKLHSKRALWEEIRTFFRMCVFQSMAALLAAVAGGIVRQQPVLQNLQLGAVMPLHDIYTWHAQPDPIWGEVEPDWVGVWPLGHFLVVGWARDGTDGACGVETFDIQTGAFVGRVSDGHHHGDLGILADSSTAFSKASGVP